jgi:hypothetical protein
MSTDCTKIQAKNFAENSFNRTHFLLLWKTNKSDDKPIRRIFLQKISTKIVFNFYFLSFAGEESEWKGKLKKHILCFMPIWLLDRPKCNWASGINQWCRGWPTVPTRRRTVRRSHRPLTVNIWRPTVFPWPLTVKIWRLTVFLDHRPSLFDGRRTVDGRSLQHGGQFWWLWEIKKKREKKRSIFHLYEAKEIQDIHLLSHLQMKFASRKKGWF